MNLCVFLQLCAGCTDQYASNFDSNARVAADTCTYAPACYEYREVDWVDATGGERHELGDDAHVRVELPFAFSWFAESFDFVNIASNGFITFGDGDLPEDGNHVDGAGARTQRAPDPAPPNNAAFAWWTDLDPSRHGGTVFTLSNSSHFVVEWNSPVVRDLRTLMSMKTRTALTNLLWYCIACVGTVRGGVERQQCPFSGRAQFGWRVAV